MMTIEDVQAQFPELVGTTQQQTNFGISISSSHNFRIAIDEQLAWAIEEFRKRKLDEIDAALRELGVEPPQMERAEQEAKERKR
jgi:hypothetical protein